jgi:putative membrane protein
MVDLKMKKTVWVRPILVMVIIGVMLLVTGSALADNGDHMDGEGMMNWGWWGSSSMWFWMIGYWFVFVIIGILVYKDAEERKMSGLLWFILVVLPWIGVLFLIIYLIIRQDRFQHGQPLKSANAILDERYARGEITQEDYTRMKRNISS